MIAKRVVLRRVEHFEQRRRRIAAPIRPDFVDLVQHDDRIHRAGVSQRANQPSRQRTDVGPAMSADFRFVAHAAKRHPHELPARGSCDGFTDRGLAGARRSDQRQDDARSTRLGHAAVGAQLAHRQVLGDAPLHVVEAFVISVQHLTGMHRVEMVLGSFGPGDRQEPVEIRADHSRLRVRLAHSLETGHLAFGLLSHGLGHPCIGDLLTVLFRHGPFSFTKFLANRVHLAAQEIFALLLLRAVLDIVSNAFAHL